MQESGCQANEQGEGGEQGIMQISQDKVRQRLNGKPVVTDNSATVRRCPEWELQRS